MLLVVMIFVSNGGVHIPTPAIFPSEETCTTYRLKVEQTLRSTYLPTDEGPSAIYSWCLLAEEDKKDM